MRPVRVCRVADTVRASRLVYSSDLLLCPLRSMVPSIVILARRGGVLRSTRNITIQLQPSDPQTGEAVGRNLPLPG